jgi:hypothetical protein
MIILMGISMHDKAKWARYEIFPEATKDGKSYKLCYVPLECGDGPLKTSKSRHILQ